MMKTARILAYGALGMPLAFAALPIYVHVPSYYAGETGMSLALLGAILLGSRLLDAGIDPWLGWLADRVPRLRMLAAALSPFAVGFVALLNPPAHFPPAVWLLGALALTYVGFSAASVAYQAAGAHMGLGSAERTKLTAAREGFGLVGVVLAAVLPGWIGSSLNAGIARLGWVLLPLLLIASIVTFRSIRVGAQAGLLVPQPAVRQQALWSSMHRVFADTAFRQLLAVFIVNGIAAALPATLFLFFVADVLRLDSAGGPLLALYFVSGAVSLPLWVRLAARYGRAVAWLLSMLLSVVAFASTGLLGSGDLWPFAVICIASGLALGADLTLPAAIAADLGERQGQAGAYFGVWNFAAKVNLALAAGLALPLLGALGYVPGSETGLGSLTFAYALLPLLFKALAALLLWRWRHGLEIDL